MDEAELNALASRMLEGAFAVHTVLGPGLLESAYKTCLRYELQKRGLRVDAEVPVPLVYDGQRLGEIGYRLDLLIENAIVIEVKALEVIAPVHRAQLLSYLRLSERRLGYLLNFNVPLLKHGVVRLINGY